MANKTILMSDENDNALYPHTLAKSVFMQDGGCVEEEVEILQEQIDALQEAPLTSKSIILSDESQLDNIPVVFFNDTTKKIYEVDVYNEGMSIFGMNAYRLTEYRYNGLFGHQIAYSYGDASPKSRTKTNGVWNGWETTATTSKTEILQEQIDVLEGSKADKVNAKFTGIMTLNGNTVVTTDQTGEYVYVKEFFIGAPTNMTDKTIKLSFSGAFIGKIRIMITSSWFNRNSNGYIEKEFNYGTDATTIRNNTSRYINEKSLTSDEFSIGEIFIEDNNNTLLIKSNMDNSANPLNIRVEFNSMYTSHMANAKTLTCSIFYSDPTPNNDNGVALATTKRTAILDSWIMNNWRQYRANSLDKIGNRVFMLFEVQDGIVNKNTIVLNLPLEYRPKAITYLVGDTKNLEDTYGDRIEISIEVDGNVIIRGADAKKYLKINMFWEV